MPPFRSGSARTAALLTGAVLVAGCASGAVHRAHPVPRAAPTSAAPTSPVPGSLAPSRSPSKAPVKPHKASSPDSLGARRVIPVPKAVAVQQQHRLLAVDGQATLLDAAPGIYPRPLLLVLHGMGESALTMRQQTGFTALAALDGFDVAYPDAPEDPAITTAAAVFVRSRAVVAQPASAAPTATPTPTPSAASPTPAHTPTPTPKATPTPSKSPSKTPPPSASHKPTPSPKPSPRATPTPKKRPSPLVAGRRAWNAGICCALALRNDVGYLVDVVNAVSQAVPVDATRVYVVGFSNGGMMALRAICSAPDVFAAAGSVSGPFLGTSCARPIWRHIAAAADPIVPVFGGISLTVPELGTVRDWCGCTWPATTTERARYGAFASVYISPTGGHTWPTPTSANWAFDPERDLWGYVSRFHL